MFWNRHQHNYQPAAVDYRRMPFGGTTTLVLWRCPCAGAAYSSALDGNWTLAQVRGEPEPAEPLPGWERDLLEKQAEARSGIPTSLATPAMDAGQPVPPMPAELPARDGDSGRTGLADLRP
jgi:hypothetical protein